MTKMKQLFLLLLVHFSAHAALNPIDDAIDRRQFNSKPLLQALDSNSLIKRHHAVRALSRTLDPQAAPLLLPRLKDGFAPIRSLACFALGQIGWSWRTQISAHDRALWTSLLIDRTNRDLSKDVRLACAEAAGRFGESAFLTSYVDWATSKDVHLRKGAFRGLLAYRNALTLPMDSPISWKLSQSTQDTVINAALSAPTRERLQWAFELAAVIRFHPDAVRINALGKLLAQDPNPNLRSLAISGLRRLPKNLERSSLFVTALSDPNPQVRTAAIDALDLTQDSQSALDLHGAELARDPFWGVRARSAQAWASVPKGSSTVAISLLNRLLTDSRSGVRLEAARSLATLDPAWAQTQAQTWIKSSDWRERVWAIERLDLTQEPSLKSVNSAQTDPVAAVRNAAFSRLASIEGPEGLQKLQALLTSGNPDQIAIGLDALTHRKETERFEWAWKVYQDAGSDLARSGIRESAIEFLLSDSSSQSRTRLHEIVSTEPVFSLAERLANRLKERGELNVPVPTPKTPLPLSPYRDLTIDRHTVFEFQTEKGSFQFECLVESAPIHCATLLGQVRAKAYDGMLWHRIVLNFVAQNSNLAPEPGVPFYTLRSEFNSIRSERGIIGMPRSSLPDSANGGEYGIYINLVSNPGLDTQYTNFGRVLTGMDVVDELEPGDTVLRARIIPAQP